MTQTAIRVAHVMAGAVHGGAERFFERLVAAQHAAGDEVLAVIRTDPDRAARLGAAGVATFQLRFGGLADPWTTPRLRRALLAFRPRVAVSWMNRATDHFPAGDWVHVGRLGGYYALRHYRRCDHLVGNTAGIVAWLRSSGWPVARTHHVPNFAEDFATARAAELGCDLLALGRLHRDKGFDVLLHALALLPECRLAIAGDGPEMSNLERLARRLGIPDRVRFLGWRGDPGSLLRAARVFVCSSRVEPLGNMVIEAWSAGTPVVAARAAGPSELIDDGGDGLLVPIDDAESLAAAIRKARDPKLSASLVAAGRQRYDLEFAAAPVLAQWRAFLSRVGNRP